MMSQPILSSPIVLEMLGNELPQPSNLSMVISPSLPVNLSSPFLTDKENLLASEATIKRLRRQLLKAKKITKNVSTTPKGLCLIHTLFQALKFPWTDTTRDNYGDDDMESEEPFDDDEPTSIAFSSSVCTSTFQAASVTDSIFRSPLWVLCLQLHLNLKKFCARSRKDQQLRTRYLAVPFLPF
jgi:hypothetical protein